MLKKSFFLNVVRGRLLLLLPTAVESAWPTLTVEQKS